MEEQILAALKTIIANQEATSDRLDSIESQLNEIQEAISNLNLPGTGYSIERYDE